MPTWGPRSSGRISTPSPARRWRWPPTTRVPPACAFTGCCPIRSSTSTAFSAWPRGCDEPDDLLAERHVANRIGRGRARLAVFRDAVIELDKLELECRL